MKIKGLMMSLLLLSAVSFGLATFYSETAVAYNVPASQFGELNQSFNQYSIIDTKLKSIESSITNINILNPLTWGNVINIAINIMLLMTDLPGVFHAMLTDMVLMTGILPAWSAWLVEAAILIIIIFSIIELLQGSGSGV